jgi:hypothetical protein
MSVKNQVKAIPLAFLDTATISAITFTPIGTLPQAVFLIRFFNPSNTNVFVSFDGVNTADFVPSGGGILELNFQANAQPNNFLANLAKGTKVYAAGLAGVGFVYMSAYYQPQQPS